MEIFALLDYSGVLQSAQFYLFMWLFWHTPSTLKIAKSSPPLFSFLLPLRTGRTEIKCAGTSVLVYARVLRLSRWCRQNSHVTCSKKMADHCLHVQKYFVSLDLFRSTPKCPVLLVYVAVLAYAEYSKIAKSRPPLIHFRNLLMEQA